MLNAEVAQEQDHAQILFFIKRHDVGREIKIAHVNGVSIAGNMGGRPLYVIPAVIVRWAKVRFTGSGAGIAGS